MKSLFILFAVTISFISYGQEIKVAPVIGIGVAGALNSSDLKDSDTKNSPAIKGSFGAWAEFASNEKIGFRSGLIFTGKGETMKASSGDAKASLKITYLEIPLLLNYRINDSGLKLLVGPSLNFALSAKTKYQAGSETETDTHKIGNDPDKDDIKPIDLSLNLGIAKDFSVMDKPLEISLMASPSLTSFLTYTKEESSIWSRHYLIGIKAAYFFSLSK